MATQSYEAFMCNAKTLKAIYHTHTGQEIKSHQMITVTLSGILSHMMFCLAWSFSS
jgi:hypothetical protein